ncbi:hypothetical protein OXX59_002563 [Metschnikowia pulcherrima]
MKLLLTLLSAYIALTNAAPVTVTKTVVVSTQYSTSTVSGSPFTSASEVVSTSTGASVSSSAAVPSSESTSTSAPVAATTSATATSSSAASSSSATSSSLNSFEAAILEEHNVKRALHGANALTWDTTLAQYAADYAASSFSCDNVQLIHSGGPYGENLAAGYVGGAAPVDAWCDEISQYDYSNPGFSEATGHFTQVIWASTTKVGCAEVICNNAWRQYTICEYSPAGNVIGYFEENVYPLES